MIKCNSYSYSIQNLISFDNAQCIIRTTTSENMWQIDNVKLVRISGDLKVNYIKLSLSRCFYFRYNKQCSKQGKIESECIQIHNRDIEIIHSTVCSPELEKN